MSKELHITLTDEGYEQLISIINDHFYGRTTKSIAIECAIYELKKLLDVRNNKK